MHSLCDLESLLLAQAGGFVASLDLDAVPGQLRLMSGGYRMDDRDICSPCATGCHDLPRDVMRGSEPLKEVLVPVRLAFPTSGPLHTAGLQV